MYLFIICIFILKAKTTVGQFPQHLDLHQVGQIVFNNEIYNVLKPTTHTITDYFQETMQRGGKENSDPQKKRLFIDDNGFRHQWSGFEKKSQSLRKTDVKSALVTYDAEQTTVKIEYSKTNLDTVDKNDKTSENYGIGNDQDQQNKTENDVTTETGINKDIITTKSIISILTTPKSETKEAENSPLKGNSSRRNLPYSVKKLSVRVATAAPSNLVSSKPEETTSKADSKDEETKSETDSKGEETKSETESKHEETKAETELKSGEKSVVKATFFCPFLGVITMSAFVD